MTKHVGIVGCSAEGAALCYKTICTEGAGFAMSETAICIVPAQIAPFVAARIGVPQTRHLALTAARFKGPMHIEAAVRAFDGWADLSFVSGEVKNPRVNLPRAILEKVYHANAERLLGIKLP